MGRRDPDGGNEPGSQQASQGGAIAGVRLDLGGTDRFDEQRMGHRDRGDQRRQLIIHLPGIGRCFEYDRIGWLLILCPVHKLREGHAAGAQEDLLLLIHRCHHDGMFVDIQANEAVGRAAGGVGITAPFQNETQ